MKNMKFKKLLWGIFFLLIGIVSILSFVILHEKNYKMLLLGILMIAAGVSELLFSDIQEKKENDLYAQKAATITVLFVFLFCIVMVFLLYLMPEAKILSSISSRNVFEIIAGVTGACYLGTYFVLKCTGGKKHD